MKYVILRKSGPWWNRKVERIVCDGLGALDRELHSLASGKAFQHTDEYKIVIKRLSSKADELLDLMVE